VVKRKNLIKGLAAASCVAEIGYLAFDFADLEDGVGRGEFEALCGIGMVRNAKIFREYTLGNDASCGTMFLLH
jgi:hypothetical protein